MCLNKGKKGESFIYVSVNTSATVIYLKKKRSEKQKESES